MESTRASDTSAILSLLDPPPAHGHVGEVRLRVAELELVKVRRARLTNLVKDKGSDSI